MLTCTLLARRQWPDVPPPTSSKSTQRTKHNSPPQVVKLVHASSRDRHFLDSVDGPSLVTTAFTGTIGAEEWKKEGTKQLLGGVESESSGGCCRYFSLVMVAAGNFCWQNYAHFFPFPSVPFVRCVQLLNFFSYPFLSLDHHHHSLCCCFALPTTKSRFYSLSLYLFSFVYVGEMRLGWMGGGRVGVHM